MAKPLYKNLTVQVLTAIATGIAIGYFKRDWGQNLRPVADGFIRLVRMVVAPIIFLTVVVGIANMGDLKKVGRVGGKALVYFEVVTTIALAIGLLVAHYAQPGRDVDTSKVNDPAAQAQVQQYKDKAKKQTTTEFILHTIPENVVGAFAEGDLIQILFFAVLFGVAIASLGYNQSPLVQGMEALIEVMFRIVAFIMKVAPLGALAAMAYTVGKFGIEALGPLMKLMACVYLTMAIFIFVVLGTICRLFGFSLLAYLKFIREEILLVLGTSSSETALPRMIEKLELMGCERQVVRMVIPAGYSFNLDGTSIYLSMAVLFIAQAYGIHLGFGQQVSVMLLLMLTSKGAAAVTGAGFVTLSATLVGTGVAPPEGLVLVFGVDRFMSEARAITNLIGNGVATICVSKWERQFDQERYRAAISGQPIPASVRGLPAEVAGDIARDENAEVKLKGIES